MAGATVGVGAWLGRRAPGCAACRDLGWVYDPPLEQQEEEGRAGQRKYLDKRPCTCVVGRGTLIVNGRECSIDAG